MNSLGIIGGGQLGMFICQAAKALELKLQFFLKRTISVLKNFVINILLENLVIQKFWKSFINSANFFTIETENIPFKYYKKFHQKKKFSLILKLLKFVKID